MRKISLFLLLSLINMSLLMMEVVHTDKAPKAIGPYSQAIKANGFVFTSGQVAFDPVTGEVVGKTIEEQTEQLMKNLKAVLDESGSSFEKIVKATCYLANMDDFDGFNKVYAKYMVSKPARSTVAVKTLAPGLLAEITVIALC